MPLSPRRKQTALALAIADAGFNNSEGSIPSCETARKLLGEDCMLSDQQVEALLDELMEKLEHAVLENANEHSTSE